MEGRRFTKWLRQLPLLSKNQRGRLLKILTPALGLDRLCEAIEGMDGPAPCCPACKAERPYRHGRNRGLQRYRCRACGKTFTALSGTPLSRLRHRAKWLDYLDKMLDANSVRAAAKAVGVHRNTSFRWRHRFLELAKHDRPQRLNGIAEADELFLLAYHRRFRQWLARFHGVASRYLPNYLGWQWALDGARIASPERFLRAAMGLFHT